jgi:hypothetical protein
VKIIGICGGKYGEAKVGKTSAAEAVRDGLDFFYVSLAKPIMDVCLASSQEPNPENLNEICIRGRKISKDYWLNLALADIPEGTESIVLDDLWFEEEASFVTSQGGMVIEINRPGVEKDPFRDFVPCIEFDNDLTEEELRVSVVNIVSRYFGIMPKQEV